MARMPKVYGQGAAVRVGVAETHQDAAPVTLRSVPSEYTNPDLHRTIMTPDGADGMQCSLSIHGTDSYRLIETVNDDPEIP